MLPKIHRLPLRTEFKKLKLEGLLVHGKYFSLLTRKRKDGQPSRFAFIVSKKVHLLSTKRNYVRRLLSEAVYSSLTKYKNDFDIVFFVRRAIIGQELPEIKNEIEKVLASVNENKISR
jgi:ribonuclease P protein component